MYRFYDRCIELLYLSVTLQMVRLSGQAGHTKSPAYVLEVPELKLKPIVG